MEARRDDPDPEQPPPSRSVPQLRLVDEHGEISEKAPQTLATALIELQEAHRELASIRHRLVESERTYAELQRKYHGVLTQLGNMRADRAAEAEGHELWPKAVLLFNQWKLATNHPRSRWSADRFWLCHRFLREPPDGYGYGMCLRAVAGIAYDPNTRVTRNGATERFDSWELLFRSNGTLERYANRAPRPDRAATELGIDIPPQCRGCRAAMSFVSAERQMLDEAAEREYPGWRCPECEAQELQETLEDA